MRYLITARIPLRTELPQQNIIIHIFQEALRPRLLNIEPHQRNGFIPGGQSGLNIPVYESFSGKVTVI